MEVHHHTQGTWKEKLEDLFTLGISEDIPAVFLWSSRENFRDEHR
jgi:hypothetical protein